VATDELVPPAEYVPTAQKLDDLGYRYELDVFAPIEHNGLAINDEFAPAAAFLGTTRVDRDPSHVTFVRVPSLDYPKLGFVADHAYWTGGIELRDPNADSGHGTVDVVSHGFGRGDAPADATQHGAGTLTGGTFPALAFASQSKAWGDAPSAPKLDQLDVNATNVKSLTIDAPRARVTCGAKVNVKSDGPLALTLTGCERSLLPSSRSCVDTRKWSFRLHHSRKSRVVSVVAYVNGKRKMSRRGTSISRVTLKRLPQKTFKVRIVATQSNGTRLISSRTYRGCKKGRPRGRRHR
jgi:hypothetical protein